MAKMNLLISQVTSMTCTTSSDCERFPVLTMLTQEQSLLIPTLWKTDPCLVRVVGTFSNLFPGSTRGSHSHCQLAGEPKGLHSTTRIWSLASMELHTVGSFRIFRLYLMNP